MDFSCENGFLGSLRTVNKDQIKIHNANGYTTGGAAFSGWKYQRLICENLLDQKKNKLPFDIVCFESTKQWQKKGYDFYVGKVENIVYVGKEEGDCEPGPGGRLEAKYFDTRKIPVDNWAIKMR